MKVLDGQQLLKFIELIEDRHARKSTIISSQLPVGSWYDILAKNATIAEIVKTRNIIDMTAEDAGRSTHRTSR